jgi:PEP-CTERM motif
MHTPLPSPRSARMAARVLALCAVCAWQPASATTAPRIEVQFGDNAAFYSSYHADLARAASAAAQGWTQHLAGDYSGLDLTVRINFVSLPTATGRSLTSGFAGELADGTTLWHQGAMHELMTGVDPNGSEPDVEINIGTDGYLQHELWFDPDPWQRLTLVPADRTDAVSVLLHEWGHALAFNGWRDGHTGALTGGYASTFDAQVDSWTGADGLALMFSGSQSLALHGAAVPLTLGNYAHLGNAAGRVGEGLIGDLMNGVQFERGTRYEVSPLNLAMLRDMGVPVLSAVPEPTTWALLLAGLGTVVWVARRRATGQGSRSR